MKKDIKTKKPSGAEFKMLAGFADGLKGKFAAAVLIMSVSILFNYLNPQVIRITVDSVIGEEPFNLPQFAVDFINSFGGRIYCY